MGCIRTANANVTGRAEIEEVVQRESLKNLMRAQSDKVAMRLTTGRNLDDLVSFEPKKPIRLWSQLTEGYQTSLWKRLLRNRDTVPARTVRHLLT